MPSDISTPSALSSRTTEVGLDPVSALSVVQHLPNLMTGVFTRLMQEHFAGAAQLGYTIDFDGKLGLENYIWNDNETTKIQIQPLYKLNLQDVQRRPALYIKRNKWSTKKLAVNDGQSVSVERSAATGKITRINGDKHSRMVIGSHTIFAVAKSGAEAELIAAEVFDYLISFAPILRSELCLHNFEVLDLEEIKPVKEWTDIFTIPIVVGYAKCWTWRLEAVSPFLQKFAIDLRNANS